MNTYTVRTGLVQGGYDYIMIHGYGDLTMKVFARCNVLGMLKDSANIRATKSIRHDDRILDLYAYATKDDPRGRELTWLPHPMEKDGVEQFLKDRQEFTDMRPVIYPSGEQVHAVTNCFTLYHDVNGIPRIYPHEFIIYEELVGPVEDDKWQLRIVHATDPVSVYGARPSGPVDYIFGLSELQYRLDTFGLMDCSALVISYRGEEYQTREYVFRNAIRKGWDSEDLKVLADLLSSGKVVFAGYEDLYTGQFSDGFRLMCIGDLAMYEHKAGRDFKIGIEIGEDLDIRMQQYLRRDKSRKYRYNETECRIRKLGI